MTMTELDFANSKWLQIGDRLIREKGIYSKHHGIYSGVHNGIPLVAENQTQSGVQYVSLGTFLKGDAKNLTRVEQYNGSEYARKQIIPRINKLIGTHYNLINFNCEHFAELIQNGKPKSKQVDNAMAGIGIAALLYLLFATGE